MLEVSEKTTEKIYSYVKKDLQPTYWGVSWRVALSVAIGGVLSLLFCGQFGLGFSEMARHWNHAVHANMGVVQCAIVCGATFAIVPVIVLRIICSGILFRRIIRGYGVVQGLAMLGAGVVMWGTGTFMNEAINIVLWAASAYITYNLLGLIVDQAQTMLKGLQEA